MALVANGTNIFMIIIIFLMLTIVLYFIKKFIDKLGVIVNPKIAARIQNGKNVPKGSEQAFRYVYKATTNNKINNKVLGIGGSFLFAGVITGFGDYENIVVFIFAYVLYVLMIQLMYVIKVYNKSK